MDMKKNQFIHSLLLITTFSLVFVMTSCGTESGSGAQSYSDSSAMQESSAPLYDVTLVNNTKDPVCGMPVTAGISDTVHYKNDVLGFCSAECKAEFQKSPESMLAAAEMKKK